MLYYFNKDKSETEMQKKKKKGFMHWEGAVTDWMCQK